MADPASVVTSPDDRLADRIWRRMYTRFAAAVWPLGLGLLAWGFNVAGAPTSAVDRVTPRAVLAGTAGLTVAAIAIPWRRLRHGARTMAIYTALLMLAPLQAGMLPWNPQAGLLVAVPILWLAIYNSRRQMMIGLLLALGLLWLPDFTSPTSLMSIVGETIIPSALIAVVGVTVHTLVERNRLATTRINQLAHTDSLTGLANRRGWDAELPRALARASRESRPVTVMLADFNQFKHFNDRFGHQAGDALLKKAADEWLIALREVDFLSRWGGDEFALILPNCPTLFAKDVVTRLNEATPYGQEASFGLVTWDGRESVEELTRRADASLYAVKERRSQARLADDRAAAVERATRGIRSPQAPSAS